MQVCVNCTKPQKGISDVSLPQITAINSVPEGSHAERGADLNGVVEVMGGGLCVRACVCEDQTRQDVNCHPSTRELL